VSAEYPAPRGSLSARVHGAEMELRERANGARSRAAEAEAHGLVEFAASLRGKARAYNEAADVVKALDRGRPLPKARKWRLKGPIW
jgi:hypothetical protein